MTTQNYYDLLGVEKSASFDEIKRAFRVKAKECHPDYHPGDTAAEAKFKEINEAYEVLKDDQKRAAYDRYGHQAYTSGMNGAGGASGFGGFDFSGTGFESIFEEMFSGFAGRARSAGEARANRGADLRYDLEISLQEAYDGLKKSIDVETYVSCDDCSGKGGKSLEQCDTCGGYGHIRQRQGFFMLIRNVRLVMEPEKKLRMLVRNVKEVAVFGKKELWKLIFQKALIQVSECVYPVRGMLDSMVVLRVIYMFS